MKFFRHSLLTLGAALTIPLLVGARAHAQNVVIDWDNIATTSIITTAKEPPGVANVWFAYVHLAVYDAVNAIDGGHQPYLFTTSPPVGASEDAAAVTAAHDVLVHYFPAQQATLDSAETASLAAISDSPANLAAGEAVGAASAAALIAARANDGLLAKVPYTPPLGPGFWQPTPPAFAPAIAPWLGQMVPFTMSSASEFTPKKGPPPLTSHTWIKDYNEVKAVGALTGSTRTPTQTEIALFWTENPTQQYARTFRGLAVQLALDVPDTARFMAALWAGATDGLIGCWNGKFEFSFWRPVTAIPAGGGNSKLAADPNWLPLAPTPPHPEYPSAHGCATGAVTGILKEFLPRYTTISVTSLVTNTTHDFATPDALMDEVSEARVLAGFHYRHSVHDGKTLGRKVSARLLKKFFKAKGN
jgi:hypothetical protein